MKPMAKMKNLRVYLFLIVIIIAMITNSVFSQGQRLEVTVTTDKPSYRYREPVTVHGNVTYEGQPVENGLVGIQIEDPTDKTIVLRTVPAGEIPSASWQVEVISIISCDGSGKPKSTFNRKTFAYFKATVKNNDINPRNALVSINIYDIDLTPIGIAWEQLVIPPKVEIMFMPGIYIDEWVSTGSALACVNVYTDWPKNNGYPHCPEKNVNFSIATTTAATCPNEPAFQNNGYYEGIFRVPPEEAPYSGIYFVVVGAWSVGWKAFQNTTFTVEYQVPADLDHNHKIEIYDVIKVTAIYGAKSGDPNWNPVIDLKPDGSIGIYDVVRVTGIYGMSY